MTLRKWNEKLIAKWEAEGRGNGERGSYHPWLQVQDIPSLGRSRRVYGEKIQREHHFFSDVEFNLFLCLEWAQDVVDIREQYPLDRELTLAVADSLGIRHPHYPGTHVPTVMTIDFLVTRLRDGKEVIEALNAKVVDEAEDDTSLHKLEIQREACALLDFKHDIIFDKAIPKQVASNINWIRDALPKLDEPGLRSGKLEELCTRMHGGLLSASRDQTLQHYCENFDRRFGLPQGMGLRTARILLYKRVLKADMQCADLPTARLSTFAVTGSHSKLLVIGAR